MPQILHVTYRPTAYWAHPLLNMLNSKASLASKHAEWPRHVLSDLAFSIETRLGALTEIVRQVDANLNELGRELERATSLDAQIQSGFAYSFENEEALRRVLIGANCFIAESRSCFENLATFYREFFHHYFGNPRSAVGN